MKEYLERAVIFAAVTIVGAVLVLLAVIALSTLNSAQAAPLPLELKISVIIDRDYVDKVGEASARIEINSTLSTLEDIYFVQTGLVVSISNTGISHISDDTQPLFLLGQVEQARTSGSFPDATGATLFFTERNLIIGNRSYYGYSAGGPVCSANAAAVVHLTHNPGIDPYVAAHEIAHLFGVPHDGDPPCENAPAVGYIMQAAGTGATQFSQCSQQVLRDAIKGAACLTPQGQKVESTAPPLPDQKIGAGSFDGTILLVLCIFTVGFYVWMSYYDDAG